MHEDQFVYCVKCKNFKVDLSRDSPFFCKYDDECNIWDFDCGRRFSERPHYEGLAGVLNEDSL